MRIIPPSSGSVPGWMQIVANAVNPSLKGYPFQSLGAAPANVSAGFTYYDTTLNKVRTWDGSAWNNHF